MKKFQISKYIINKNNQMFMKFYKIKKMSMKI